MSILNTKLVSIVEMHFLVYEYTEMIFCLQQMQQAIQQLR